MGWTSGSPVLEREGQLAALAQARAAVGAGGTLVLLGGEAGAGKTTLLRRFTGTHHEKVLWGGCDPLFTPRPLGPFVDIAQGLGVSWDGARPYDLAGALVGELRARPGTVLVLEDLHWADEATLDVVSLLGRRIASVPALVVVSYRADELGRGHPLRRLVGELREAVRVEVGPLSPAGVGALAGPGLSDVDVQALHRATGGNPFFVTEALAAPGNGLPATVRDAVLARVGRLDEAARRVVEAVAIAVPQAELGLLDALVTKARVGDGVAGGLDAGILQATPGGIGFRHELARLAVEESLTPYRRRALHRRALRHLSTADGTAGELARLAHHAEAAQDAGAVLRFAPAAAEQAAASGAHREAAAQYERALRYGAGLSPGERASLLERRSYECYLTDQSDEAIEALTEAVAYRAKAGDRAGEGAALSMLSRRLWCGGHVAEAAVTGRDAVRLLGELPPGPELALAYGNLGQVFLNDERAEECLDWSGRALALVEDLDRPDITVHSLNNLGTMRLLTGDSGGLPLLERSLDLAQRHGLEEHVGRAYIHAGWALQRTREPALAAWLDPGVRVCERLGLDAWRLYVQAYRARHALDQGRWDDAVTEAQAVLGEARSVPLLRVLVLSVLGLVAARRGEDPWPALNEASELLKDQGELQFLGPVALARAEATWLEGRWSDVDGELRGTLELAQSRRADWVTGELAWLSVLAGGACQSRAAEVGDAERAGCAHNARGEDRIRGADRAERAARAGDVDRGEDLARDAAQAMGADRSWGADQTRGTDRGRDTPFARQLRGDVNGAVAQWEELGCPYDAALARLGSDDEEQLRLALTAFQDLGARPAATIAARRLRERGARRVPRGPRPETRRQPGNLTRREAEVLSLVASGLSNADIASRLFLSERTVHHHVAAILRKLDVTSRGQAAAEAARIGIGAGPT